MRPSLESAVHGSRGLGHGAHSPPTREAGTLNCMSSMLPAWENPPRHHSMARLRACDFTPHAPKSSTRDWVGGHARPAPRVQSLTKTDKRRHGPRPPLSAELRSDTTIGSGRAWGGRQNRKGGCFLPLGHCPSSSHPISSRAFFVADLQPLNPPLLLSCLYTHCAIDTLTTLTRQTRHHV
jgi:hypothetical protein